MSHAVKQQGSTLIYSLVMLLVMTTLALSSVTGIGLQERMASNLYDRGLAFQAAEAALRAGEAAIEASSAPVNMVDCSPDSGTACPPVPATTFQNNDTNWTDVSPDFAVNYNMMLGTPQYHIQLMGRGNGEAQLGQQNSANSNQYGFNGGALTEQHYRITARSSNPNVAQNRAVVVLQTTVKRDI